MHLKVIHSGDAPPCIEQVLLCRGCFGWKSMLQAAREIPLWQKYPLRCECTGLTVRFEPESNRQEIQPFLEQINH